MHALDSAWEKIDRANERSREISNLVGAFAQTKPYAVVEKIDDDTGDKLYVAGGKPVAPPLSIAITLGEVLYNLRSCLDRLAWQLVIANGHPVPSNYTAFPLIDDPDKWTQRFTTQKVKWMSDRARALIKSVQPCFGVNPVTNEWLSWLENLTNIDKHRHLNAVTAGLAGAFFSPMMPPGTFVYEGGANEGTILARVPKAYPDVNLSSYFQEVALSEGPAADEGITLVTSALRSVTESTLRLFAGFFPPRL